MVEKVKLKYVGKHMENGIYEVPKNKVEALLESGNYELPGKKVQVKKQKDTNVQIQG